MSEDINIRWGWLKFMYLYTIFGSGLLGVGMIVVPEVVKSLLKWPVEEPTVFGIAGSIYATFGLLSLLGLRSPLKFVPVLLAELCYKSIWFIGVALPLLIAGKFPDYAIPMVVIFATYIVGNLIAIPFPYVFVKNRSVGK
jgi:hypothetical protein